MYNNSSGIFGMRLLGYVIGGFEWRKASFLNFGLHIHLLVGDFNLLLPKSHDEMDVRGFHCPDGGIHSDG